MARGFAFRQDNNSNSTQDESWKAGAFINIHLDYGDGRRPKLGAIALRPSKPDEKALLEWLAKDPENNQKHLEERLVIDFRMVRNDGAKFAGLPGFEPPKTE